MIIDKVLKAAEPYLNERTIKDLVIGLSLIGVELDNGHIGLAYMLRENLPPGCSVFSFAQELIGQNANKIAELLRNGEDDAQRGVAMAVLSAASRSQSLVDIASHSSSFGVEVLATDTVGMVGFIPPIAAMLSKKAKEVIIFDKGFSQSGRETEGLYPIKDQSKLLPKCDVVLITGTTITNGTIEDLLKICSSAREIVLVGSSVPMFPQAFKDTKVTVLAGAWWNNELKEELFKTISLAGGIKHVNKAMIKKAIPVTK